MQNKQKIIQSILAMLNHIKSEEELIRIHNFIQCIYINKKK